MYDQLTAVYNRYRVFSCKYDVCVTNTTLDFPVILAFSSDNVSGSFTTITGATSCPFSKYNCHGPYPTMTSTKREKGSYNIAKVLGYTANIEDDLSSLVTTNPA